MGELSAQINHGFFIDKTGDQVACRSFFYQPQTTACYGATNKIKKSLRGIGVGFNLLSVLTKYFVPPGETERPAKETRLALETG